VPDSTCSQPPSRIRNSDAIGASWLRQYLADRTTWAALVVNAMLTATLLASCRVPQLAGAIALVMAAMDVLRWRRAIGLRPRAADAANPQAENLRTAAARLAVAELALDRVDAVIESLREGVIVVDAAGEVVLCNPAARRMTADPVRREVGMRLTDLLQPELARRAADALADLRSQGAAVAGPVRYPSIECQGEVFDLTAVPVRSARSRTEFGTVFLFVNATRGHELARLKDRFLSSISHELRTPLTNICAYAEILQHLTPGESAEWPEFVRVIASEGHALSATVDAVFDYLQLESGDAVLHQETTDATDLVRIEVEAARTQAQKAGIDLQFGTDGEPPRVRVDPCRLRQAVRHLLANGLKFTPPGGQVRVTVATRDCCWVLRVDDSGPGVPAPERRAVFDKFHQLNDHLTEKPSGAGLGLATTRAIVALFGGMIWCEDSPLGGAGFVVLLPAHDMPRLAAVDAGAGEGGGF
jgi:signal transduction histidine kinase